MKYSLEDTNKIELTDLFREENQGNCRKCGLSLNNKYHPHNEKTCDYVEILPEHVWEATLVDDIEITAMQIKAGYGIWELAMIYKIMEDLWKNDHELRHRLIKEGPFAPGLSRTHDGVYMGYGRELFKEAEKLYKEQANGY